MTAEDSQEEDREGWEKVTRGRKSRVSSASKEKANSVQDSISSCSRPETKPTNESSGSGSTTPANPDSHLPEAVSSKGSPEIPASVDPVTAVVGMEYNLQSNGQVKNDLSTTASDLGEVCIPASWYCMHICLYLPAVFSSTSALQPAHGATSLLSMMVCCTTHLMSVTTYTLTLPLSPLQPMRPTGSLCPGLTAVSPPQTCCLRCHVHQVGQYSYTRSCPRHQGKGKCYGNAVQPGR